MTFHKSYSGTDSPFLVAITDITGVVYTEAAMAAITRCRLRYVYQTGADAVEADSSLAGHDGYFDTLTYASIGHLQIDVGLSDFPEGRDPTAEVIIYDATYTSGRVVCQIDLQVSNEAGQGTAASLRTASRTITGTDELVLADFYRKSIRFNSVTDGTLTMPVMTEAYDGEKIKIIIENVGNCTLQCQGTTTIINESLTAITGSTQYGSIELEYDYAIDALIICGYYGEWNE